MNDVIRDLAHFLPVPRAGIASSPLLDLPGDTKLVLFAMDAGQEISPHATPFPADVLLLDGALEVMVGDSWAALRPRDRRELPAGLPHALKAHKASHFLLTMLRGAVAPQVAPSACDHHADAAAVPAGSAVLAQWMREHDEALRRLDAMETGAKGGQWAVVGESARWLYQELKPTTKRRRRSCFP